MNCECCGKERLEALIQDEKYEETAGLSAQIKKVDSPAHARGTKIKIIYELRSTRLWRELPFTPVQARGTQSGD